MSVCKHGLVTLLRYFVVTTGVNINDNHCCLVTTIFFQAEGVTPGNEVVPSDIESFYRVLPQIE